MTKGKNYFEIIVGTFVLLSAIIFFGTSLNKAKVNGGGKSYSLSAKFDNISGVDIGSDVKIAGVKIGSVQEQFLDNETYRATLKIAVNHDIKLPIDSSAKISSEGLLGSKFVDIQVGADEEFLKNNEEIEFTQSSVNFEDLLGKFIFSSSEKTSDQNK